MNERYAIKAGFTGGPVTAEPHSEIEELLTPEEVSSSTKLALQTLANMRRDRRGPRFIKLGVSVTAPVRYRRSDVEAWLDSQVVETGAG
ncbi:helix-turn-helix domain-containing protein [Streptomyces tirandamycinicus]|uniref:helix-turn-helix transcriptional regulator n=1 Tax=Streptomyces tirandamycinicus TaxID=2174846 RepID=UPI00342B45F9